MHNSGVPLPDLSTLFAQAQPLTKHQEIFTPLTSQAVVDISCPATARGYASLARLARIAAADMKIPERFEGFKARFVDATQGIFLTPVTQYNEKDPDCYYIIWSKDGKELTVDLAMALMARKWATPTGYIRRAPIYIGRNLPNNVGTVFYIDLQNSTLRARPKGKRKKKGEEAEAAQQVAAAKQEPAPAQAEAKQGA